GRPRRVRERGQDRLAGHPRAPRLHLPRPGLQHHARVRAAVPAHQSLRLCRPPGGGAAGPGRAGFDGGGQAGAAGAAGSPVRPGVGARGAARAGLTYRSVCRRRCAGRPLLLRRRGRRARAGGPAPPYNRPMSTSTSRTIPLQVLSEPAAAPAPLEVGAKQLGSDKIARSPVQFADAPVLRKPSWIRARIPAGNAVANLTARLRETRLVTVCEEASCPNIHECFGHGTATFMILGEVCTRRCSFCDVAHGRPRPPDPEEPRNLARTIADMRLKYVVITSVDRD